MLRLAMLLLPCLSFAQIPDPTRFLVPEPYRQAVYYYASLYGIPLDIAIRLAYQESRWDENAINHNRNGTTDRGLYQLNDAYFATHPATKSIKVALYHLAWCYKKGGNWYKALLIWNAGHSRRNNPPEASIRFARRILDGGID